MTENGKNTEITKKKLPFLLRQRNTIIAFVIIFAVLLAGYFIVKAALDEEDPVVTEETTAELLPGEVLRGNSTLVYPYLDRADIEEVRIHNATNASRDEAYVDWAMSFAYDKDADDYYGYMTDYPLNLIDETKLTYFVAAVCTPIFSSRVEDHCTDFSPYGLDHENGKDVAYVEVELKNGTVHKIYIGKKNPGGTGYYLRSADTVTLDDGTVYVRDSVYLMNVATTSYFDMTVMALPTEMLSTMMTYPATTKEAFASFALYSLDGDITVSFLPLVKITEPAQIFGGSCLYYSVQPDGYFSSTSFETLLPRFVEFSGVEIMEFATKKVTGTDENGEEYSYYAFENDVLAKYGLDPDHMQYVMRYTTGLQTKPEDRLISEVFFSGLRPDGYYYAYSLNFNTIVKVDPSLVDFLGWSTLDFLDAYALRMNIGYCEELTVKGKIDGEVFEETFIAEIDKENVVQSAMAKSTNEKVTMDYYRMLFQELYTTVLWENVPDDLDKEALMQKEPYLEVTIKTPKLGISDRIPNGLPSVTRVLRFYQYTNGRAMMTVEMIENGESSGESGQFYVRVSRLDKLVADAKKLVEGIPFSNYDKE